MKRRAGGDGGETLVELLVAIAIMGIAAVAVLAGMQLSIKASDIQRKEADGGSHVRKLAEGIQIAVAEEATGYQTCGNVGQYITKAKTYIDWDGDYTATVQKVEKLTDAGWAVCTGSDAADGLQRLELAVTSQGTGVRRVTERLTVLVRKPCNSDTVWTTKC